MLDAYWAIILAEGRGGMIDMSKYRKTMSDYFFKGELPERTPESEEARVEAAKEAIGKPMPEDALEEARRLREMMNSGNNPENE